MNKVLTIFTNGFEDVEATTPVDILRRAELDVVIATPGEELRVTGKMGLSVTAEATLEEALREEYVALVLPGGPGAQELRKNAAVISAVQDFYGAGKHVAAICAAPVILHDAGVLSGHRYTAHFSVKEELPALIEDEPVVVDGKLITSRGAGTAVLFALELVAALRSRDEAGKVARAICLPGA